MTSPSMKIEVIKQPRCTLEEFAVKHGLTMEVIEREANLKEWFEKVHGAWRPFYCHFKNTGIIENPGFITGISGSGKSVESAIEDYANRISGKLLLLNEGTPERKEIKIPILTGVK